MHTSFKAKKKKNNKIDIEQRTTTILYYYIFPQIVMFLLDYFYIPTMHIIENF